MSVFTHSLSTNNYGPAAFIVDANAANGTHTTITTAVAAAVSGQTVFIRPGTYSENLTLKAGVNLCAYTCDGTWNSGTSPISTNVTIVGKMTATFTGNVAISGIQLKTNSDYLIETTGSNAALLDLKDCFLNCINFSGIHKTNSSARINLHNCNGDLGTTGIGYFVATSGDINFYYGNYTNSGSSITASTISSGSIGFFGVQLNNYITTSSSGGWSAVYSQFNGIYVTAGTGTLALVQSYVNAGTGLAFSIGVGTSVTLKHCQIDTTNDPSISGAGTLVHEALSFGGNSRITATTQTILFEGPSKTIGGTNTGATNNLTVSNTSNTGSSRANITASVGGTSSEDGSFSSVITGGQTWSWGGDNSDSDAYVLSANASLGTTNVMRVNTSGQINYPLQPCFEASQTSNLGNVTGDGTTYTILFATSVFDQASNYATGTGLFTAPIAGRYAFYTSINITGIGAAHTSAIIQITTTGNTIEVFRANPIVQAVSGNATFAGSCLVNMALNDTCKVTLTVSGSTKTVGISAAVNSYFSGMLVA